MLLLIPPARGPADAGAPSPLRRLLVRVLAALGTVAVTVWCCTLGWLPGILALLVAKHVLVAILLLDLGVDHPRSS